MSARDQILDRFATLSPKIQAAAKYIVDHPNEVVIQSMRTLAEVANVQPATFVRLARQDAYTRRLLAELDATFQRIGPERVIAFVVETVVGATAGAVPPTPGYFRGVRALCDRYGILLSADEVMCGMGRTGTLHAVEQEGVVPDLLTLAKGLGGGYQPIGAVLASGAVVDAVRRGSGLFQHGHTYIGHPVACAAALAVQKVIQRDRLLDAVRTRGAQLRERLRERLGAHPHVGDIRGRGLFIGVELVRDRATRAPFDPAVALHAKVKACAMEHGLLVYPMGGTIDGRLGDHVLLAPPFVVTESDGLFRSGEIVRIYDRWSMKPIPPKNVVLNFPMGAALKKAVAQPTDSPDPAAYR